MKVAIGIDTLIEKDNASHILELLIHMFPKAKLYTLCHNRGTFQAPIENCVITSSFLSNIVKSKFDFYHRTSLIPSACKTIKIPNDVDLFISLSSGFAHCFNVPKNVRHVAYLFEYNKFFNLKTNLWQKLFHPYLKNFQNKGLRNVKEVIYSSKALLSFLNGNSNESIISPVFDIEDFPFVKDDEHPYVFDHYIAVSNGVEPKIFKEVLDVFVEKKLSLKIVGEDKIYDEYKKYENLEFIGDHCNGPISFNTHFAKAMIDLTESEFPTHSLGALCNGRPVLVKDTIINREFLNKDFAYYIGVINKETLSHSISLIEESCATLDRKAMRRNALKYNGRIFKTKFHKILGTMDTRN